MFRCVNEIVVKDKNFIFYKKKLDLHTLIQIKWMIKMFFLNYQTAHKWESCQFKGCSHAVQLRSEPHSSKRLWNILWEVYKILRREMVSVTSEDSVT